MFFSKIGEYPPSGLFSPEHFILLIVTFFLIFMALYFNPPKTDAEVLKTIRGTTIVLGILEIVRIVFSLTFTDPTNLDGYMPLFFCSLFLYSGILSSFFKGHLKRVGDVFLATGGIVGGIVFLIFPSTSLSLFPAAHFLSIHSFIYHGAMVYLGILVNTTGYITLKKNDIFLYSSLVGVLCFICLLLNNIFSSNLMFLSKAFPGKYGRLFFKITGRFYPIFIALFHMFSPFNIVFLIREKIEKKSTQNV